MRPIARHPRRHRCCWSACEPRARRRRLRRANASTAAGSDRSPSSRPTTAPRRWCSCSPTRAAGTRRSIAPPPTLRDDGAAVLGVDLPSYQKGLRASDDGCHYLLERDRGALPDSCSARSAAASYRTPILAGIGEGATLAYAALAQIARGDRRGRRQRRSRADARHQGATLQGRSVHARARQGLLLRRAGGSARLVGRLDAHAASPDLAELVDDVDEPPPAERSARSIAWSRWSRSRSRPATRRPGCAICRSPRSSPRSRARWMAVIYSGDGGWRDLDKEIGEHLAAARRAGRGRRLAPLLLEREDAGRDGARSRRDHRRLRRQVGHAEGRRWSATRSAPRCCPSR